jgi:hypothetical protein
MRNHDEEQKSVKRKTFQEYHSCTKSNEKYSNGCQSVALYREHVSMSIGLWDVRMCSILIIALVTNRGASILQDS